MQATLTANLPCHPSLKLSLVLLNPTPSAAHFSMLLGPQSQQPGYMGTLRYMEIAADTIFLLLLQETQQQTWASHWLTLATSTATQLGPISTQHFVGEVSRPCWPSESRHTDVQFSHMTLLYSTARSLSQILTSSWAPGTVTYMHLSGNSSTHHDPQPVPRAGGLG